MLPAIEVVADKIPAVDTANDIIQTLVRPGASGIVFASGIGAGEVVDASGTIDWWAVAFGVAIALAIHLLKSFSRPVIDASTVGTATPVAVVVILSGFAWRRVR